MCVFVPFTSSEREDFEKDRNQSKTVIAEVANASFMLPNRLSEVLLDAQLVVTSNVFLELKVFTRRIMPVRQETCRMAISVKVRSIGFSELF